MAVVPQQRSRPALPGKQIKPFPSRSASYRALSIIDAYNSSDLLPLPQLEEYREEVKSAPLLDRNEEVYMSRKDSLKDSYASNFDVDEAYGSGDADLYDDDMDEIINLDEYDPYRSTTPPPRSSSRRPAVEKKVETRIEIVEVKPLPPPKAASNPLVAPKPAPPPKSNDDDYDPFKAGSPPKRNPARLVARELPSRSEPLVTILNRVATSPAVPPKDAPKLAVNGNLTAASRSTSQLSTLSTPRSATTDKALPTVPSMPKQLLASPLKEKALPTPNEQTHVRRLPGLPGRPNEGLKETRDTRKDSLMQSEKDPSSATSSPRARKSPALTEAQWMTPKSSFEREGATIKVPIGIKRTSKPASLNLTRSNGSTVASGGKADVAEIAEPTATHVKVQNEAGDKSAPPAPSQLSPSHVATASTLQLQDNNPIENAYALSTSEQQIISTDEAASTADMHRIKNFVKRKPVGSTSSTASSAISKENANPRGSLSPFKSHKTAAPAAKTVTSHATAHQQHNRQQSSASNVAALSPASTQSLEEFPPLEIHGSSTSTVAAPKLDNGAGPTTPPVLRSPTPLSQLEESPSKYGLKKKSERNLKSVAEERQSQILGQSANGVLRFLTAQKEFKDSSSDDAPASPIYDANTVVLNEADRNSFYHASLLNHIKERPRDSNAPQLTTTQLHCHNDHTTHWHTNDNTVYPVNCAVCDEESGSRWTCSSCGLRVCQDCQDAIKTRLENTEFRLMLKGAKEETGRLRAEFYAQFRRARSNTDRTVTLSRPGSPVVYPPSDSESVYGHEGAAASTQSLPGMMRPRSRTGGPMYPPSSYNASRIPYGRPPGHRNRASIGSLPTRDAPPTPRIPDQYMRERGAKAPPMPRGSRSSENEMRGRMGPSPERSRGQSASRHGSPMQGYLEPRARSRPRPARGMEIDPTAELRRPQQGPYAAIPRSAGARTPGTMR